MEPFNGVGACERVCFDVNLLSNILRNLKTSDLFNLRLVCRTWNELIMVELDRLRYIAKLPKRKSPTFDVQQVLTTRSSVFKRQTWILNGWCNDTTWKQTLPLITLSEEITVQRNYRLRNSYKHYEDFLQYVGAAKITNFERFGFSGYVPAATRVKSEDCQVVNVGDCVEHEDLSRFLDVAAVSEINGYVGQHFYYLLRSGKLKLVKEAVFPLELYRLDTNVKLLTEFAKQHVPLVHVEMTIINPDSYEEPDVIRIQKAIAEFLVSCRNTLRSLRVLNLNCLDFLEECPPFEMLNYVEITEAFFPLPCFTGLFAPVFPRKLLLFPNLSTLKLNPGFQNRFSAGTNLFPQPLGSVITLIGPSNLPMKHLKFWFPNASFSELFQ